MQNLCHYTAFSTESRNSFIKCFECSRTIKIVLIINTFMIVKLHIKTIFISSTYYYTF